MAHTLSFVLMRYSAYFFLFLSLLHILFPHIPGQSYFFIGSKIPFPVPWRPAPFDGYITQEGLEEHWPMVLNTLRGFGIFYLFFGYALLRLSSACLRRSAFQTEYEHKRSRMGHHVGAEVHKIELHEHPFSIAQLGMTPPLFLFALVHIGFIAGNLYLYELQPNHIQFAWWTVASACVIHAVGAVLMSVAQYHASVLWKQILAQKGE